MPRFRLLAWNVRASMTERVLDALGDDPDVDLFILSEYRIPKAGDRIGERLRDTGWPYALYSTMPPGKKGVALFARTPLRPAPELLRNWSPGGLDLTQWIIGATLPSVGLSILGTYVPFPDGPLKEAVWKALIDAARRSGTKQLAIAGDFNSCHPHEADSSRGYTIEPLERMGRVAIDLWRATVPVSRGREHVTWAGPNGMGNRLDFVFGTPALASVLAGAEHRHHLRESKVSDHSAVTIDLRLARMAPSLEKIRRSSSKQQEEPAG